MEIIYTYFPNSYANYLEQTLFDVFSFQHN